MTADPVLLFRYSALTFNGHRIHYDRPYVTGVEGYPGLIVHGPLQAALLLEYAIQLRGGTPPKSFMHRGVNPLFDGDFAVNAQPTRRRLRAVDDQSGRRRLHEGRCVLVSSDGRTS